MTYSTFNFTYNKVYTSSIKFDTIITELGEGYEKRYCKKIYPIREFTLKFNKNSVSREDLLTFIQTIEGKGNCFYYTWPASKGGNDVQYLCKLDSDRFKADWKRNGFIDSELTFVCIDGETYTPPASLSPCHNIELDFELEHSTIEDKEMTASFEDNRTSLFNNPKRRWELTYLLNEVEAKELEAFFISKKGRWGEFSWTWSTDKNGTGTTYTVRFDSDELVSDIQYRQGQGFREIKIAIKEVFPTTPTPTDEELKDYVIPRRLLKIEPTSGSNILILDNDTFDSLTYNGDVYLGAPLDMSNRKMDSNNEAGDVSITISNAGMTISNLISTYGDVITGCTCSLYRVWLNTADYTVLSDPAPELEAYGKANHFKINDATASIEIEPMYPGYDTPIPACTYGVNCQWKFKDINCKYTGDQINCDKTKTTCMRYNNIENFGGHPNLPKELVIKN